MNTTKKFRLFLDTANLSEIEKALETGIVDGIATNPQKISEAKSDYKTIVREIRRIFDGPIAVQALGQTKKEIVSHALELNDYGKNMAVKVACTAEGIAAISDLVPRGVLTNGTLIFSASQSLAAGLAASPFISPFVGRSEMAGYDGVALIRQTRQIFDAYGIKTCVVAASLKNVRQAIECVIAGADALAITYPLFEMMLRHPMTEEGYRKFSDLFLSTSAKP